MNMQEVVLLVVIAIIALLLAIPVSALNKVRKQVETVICKSYLKKISRCIFIPSGSFISTPRQDQELRVIFSPPITNLELEVQKVFKCRSCFITCKTKGNI